MSLPLRHARRVVNPAWRRCAGLQLLLLASLLCGAVHATAATHALVMWIGNYAQAEARLKGAEVDGRLGVQIARALGAVGSTQLVQLKDQQLALQPLREALRLLRQRVSAGDTVVIYFSGHGLRLRKADGPGCREGLVAYDNRLYFDTVLRSDLEAVAAVAERVIVFNDSCHAGGTITKGFSMPGATGDDDVQIKAYPLPERVVAMPGTAADACSVPSNAVAKSFALGLPEDRLVYLAAARDDEVAYSTASGSLASLAWAACLVEPATDTDHDGHISAAELNACAQHRIDQRRPLLPQHLQVVLGAGQRLMRTPLR